MIGPKEFTRIANKTAFGLGVDANVELLAHKGFIFVFGSGGFPKTAIAAHNPATGDIIQLLNTHQVYRTYNYGVAAIGNAAYVIGGRADKSVPNWPALADVEKIDNLISFCPDHCNYPEL